MPNMNNVTGFDSDFSAMSTTSATGFNLMGVSVILIAAAFMIGAAFSLSFYARINKYLGALLQSIHYFFVGGATLFIGAMIYLFGDFVGRNAGGVPPEIVIGIIAGYIGISAFGYIVEGLLERILKNYRRHLEETTKEVKK